MPLASTLAVTWPTERVVSLHSLHHTASDAIHATHATKRTGDELLEKRHALVIMPNEGHARGILNRIIKDH